MINISRGFDKNILIKLLKYLQCLNKCFYKKNNNNIGDAFKILIIGGSQASLFFSNKLKNEIIKLASKHKIEITQQISYGFDIENYKKDYDKNNIKIIYFFLNKIFCVKIKISI